MTNMHNKHSPSIIPTRLISH